MSETEARNDVQRVEVVDSLPASVVIRLFVVGIGIVILSMVSVLGFFVYSEAKARNELIYQACVDGEARDAVIVQQLEGALARVRASLPKGNTVRLEQEELLLEGIHILEPGHPPGSAEQECFTPASWWPW